MSAAKKQVPHGWVETQRMADAAIGPFLICKTPLSSKFDVVVDKIFTLKMLLQVQERRKTPIGLIVDLSPLGAEESGFYDPHELSKQTPEVRYSCVRVGAQAAASSSASSGLPTRGHFKAFSVVVRSFLNQDQQGLIAVHDTVSQTVASFMCVSYLVEEEGWALDDALGVLRKRWPPGLRDPDFIDELQRLYGDSMEDTAASGPSEVERAPKRPLPPVPLFSAASSSSPAATATANVEDSAPSSAVASHKRARTVTQVLDQSQSPDQNQNQKQDLPQQDQSQTERRSPERIQNKAPVWRPAPSKPLAKIPAVDGETHETKTTSKDQPQLQPPQRVSDEDDLDGCATYRKFCASHDWIRPVVDELPSLMSRFKEIAGGEKFGEQRVGAITQRDLAVMVSSYQVTWRPVQRGMADIFVTEDSTYVVPWVGSIWRDTVCTITFFSNVEPKCFEIPALEFYQRTSHPKRLGNTWAEGEIVVDSDLRTGRPIPRLLLRDLLVLNGVDVTTQSLSERRALLQKELIMPRKDPRLAQATAKCPLAVRMCEMFGTEKLQSLVGKKHKGMHECNGVYLYPERPRRATERSYNGKREDDWCLLEWHKELSCPMDALLHKFPPG